MSDHTPHPEHPSALSNLEPLVRGVIAPRVADQASIDDLVQETLTRLIEVEGRLDATALRPYAVVVARNLVHSVARAQERERTAMPRMLDPRQPVEPEELALQKEDERALAAALARLPAPEREPLVAHDVEGVTTAALAERLGTTPGALAVRLSRARARLLVEYLLTLRREELPSPKCKRVLLSLSTGLKRDQRALRAGEHLVACPTCASLSEPLLHRRRTLPMIWPLVGVEAIARWLRGAARSHPRPTVAVVFSAVAVVAVAVTALRPDERPDPTLWVEASSPIPLSGAEPMAPHAGKVVVARSVRVQSVADPAGFWVGSATADRLWVDVHDNAEPPRLTAGQRVNFRGTLVANTPETLETAGRSSPSDRAHLERQGFHIDIAADTLQPVSTRE